MKISLPIALLALIGLLAACGEPEPDDPPEPVIEDDGLTDPDFIEIQAGTFVMGFSEGEPFTGPDEVPRSVTLTRDFLIQSTEVTQGQWFKIMGESRPAFFSGCGQECPVERVNWFEAALFLNTLSERDGLPTCYTLVGCVGEPSTGCQLPDCGPPDRCEQSSCEGSFVCQEATFAGLDCAGWRLPTEAEWEFAARAGSEDSIQNGLLEPPIDCSTPNVALDAVGWYCANADSRTQPVATRNANNHGLFDVSGNVREWVHDAYAADVAQRDALDPTGPDEPTLGRVVRGGSWASNGADCRLARRLADDPARRSHTTGFRPVRTLP